MTQAIDHTTDIDEMVAIMDKLRAQRIGEWAVSRATGVSVWHLRRARHGLPVARTAVEKVVKAYHEGDLVCPADEPVDEVVLDRVISGDPVDFPQCGKKPYARELYARGWNRTKIAKLLHASYGSVAQWTKGMDDAE